MNLSSGCTGKYRKCTPVNPYVILISQLMAVSLDLRLAAESWTARADRNLRGHVVSLPGFMGEAWGLRDGKCLSKVTEQAHGRMGPCTPWYDLLLQFTWLQSMIGWFKENISPTDPAPASGTQVNTQKQFLSLNLRWMYNEQFWINQELHLRPMWLLAHSSLLQI